MTVTVFLCFILLPQLDEGPMGEPEGSFVDYQTTMVRTAKAIAVTVQEMVTKSNTSPEELGPLANQLTSDYGRLASQAKPAAVAAENEEVTMAATLPSLRRLQFMVLLPMAASGVSHTPLL